MPLARMLASTLDWALCAALYRVQKRHRLTEASAAALENYVSLCEPMTRDEYLAGPEVGAGLEEAGNHWRWPSPVRTVYAENDRACVKLFPCARGWSAPTVIMLHSLMSASDRGYAQWAARFNERGWNACFVHLPFHYSRVPAGFRNGELAITADLVRTGEGLRQGVCEVRQLLGLLRARGGREFGVCALSYGGWIGALLASVEELSFVALLEPIVDVEHAIWKSPAGLALRRELVVRGIRHEVIARHSHLTSPLHAPTKCAPENILLVAGEYDRIAPAESLEKLRDVWAGAQMIRVRQGHFGYGMLRATWGWLEGRGVV